MKLCSLLLYCFHLLQVAERLKQYTNWISQLYCFTLHMLMPLIVDVHAVCHLLQ